jgi:hypothetical protein
VIAGAGDRFILTHADAMYTGQHPLNARENLNLWFTRGGGVDFVPGPAYTGEENATAYPQMWIHGDTMLVCYSHGIRPRSMRVAHISPMPAADTYYIFPRSNRGIVESTTIDDRACLQFYDNYNSAGLDLDENNRDEARVAVEFEFKIAKGNENVLCTIGDAHQAVQVLVKDEEVLLQSGEKTVVCGSHEDWTRVSVETYGQTTRARVGEGDWQEVSHQPSTTWFFFGQGYYQDLNVIWKNRFLIDVNSVRSRVSRNP